VGVCPVGHVEGTDFWSVHEPTLVLPRSPGPGRCTRGGDGSKGGAGAIASRHRGRAAAHALPLRAMIVAATQAGLLAAELEARGFLAGIGKFILIVIIVLVVGGALLGFAVGRRR
jgi:hypothetical protein